MKNGLFFFCLFIFASGVLGAEEANQQLVDRVVAVVNNEVITQSEFDSVFRPIYDQMRSAYQGPDLERQLQEVRLKLLNQMIEDRLVYQESKKMGVEVSDSEIREELDAFKKQFPSEADFQESLRRERVDVKDIETRIRERIAIQKLHEGYIRAKVAVSPQEVEQYFRDHRKEFEQKERVEAWIISLTKDEEATEKGMTDERVKKEARFVWEELKRGADFSETAKKHSQDTHAEQGGYIGFVERGDLVKNIEGVIFALPAGNFSDVVETERAYHIFKVGRKEPPAEKSFEEVQNQVREIVFRQKSHERFLEWMETLKKKSFISIK